MRIFKYAPSRPQAGTFSASVNIWGELNSPVEGWLNKGLMVMLSPTFGGAVRAGPAPPRAHEGA
eukprot:5617924-Pyramimonas_sp.AAC.1